ncbi:DUF7824 domain-containing protein [Actinoplanes derwentensis]|uniref:DUF7824 domain-containing protein n=1 Tax=Actinoplanes derwentensis TaxID=113562 RepID=A0A1H1QVC7_9ACTN|nr:DUF6493 family protein [Actinoplanes derwentensis]GID87071.1 hypothetical protein Ade03nite_59950 [Actinoplanes derwentensis]SDS27404.1 hypothetical protein SAMN04489716_0411 [Actinoplanes derwentensis]
MSLTWETLEGLAGKDHGAGIVRLLTGATEAERLAVFKAVEAGIKGADPSAWWRDQINPAGAFAIAVLGTAPTAQKAAALLTRRNLRDQWRWMPVGYMLDVAAAREVDWLGDLGHRLAQRLSTRDVWDSSEFDFTAAFMRAGGVEPPVTESVVKGWLAGLIRPRGKRVPPLTMRLRDDPYLDLLLPSVFEIDGLGADIFNAAWSDGSDNPGSVTRFPGAVAALVAEGRLERKTVLAATVDRLARGDRPNALRPFVVLHETLAPTVDEIAEYSPDYHQLLAEAPGPIAALAQTALRTLDDSGRLDPETLLDASVPMLVRKEKTLVKAQIAWLERLARREPGQAGAIYETIAAAFGHPALDIQERALTLIAKQLPGLDPGSAARIAGESSMLAGDLTARAAEIFGTTVAAGSAPVAPVVLVPVETPLMPPPITTAAELAEELVILLHDQTGVRWERVLAAVVTLHAGGRRAELAGALAPILDRHSGWFDTNRWNSGSPFHGLGTAIRMSTDPPRHDTGHQQLYSSVRIAWQEGRRGGGSSKLSASPTGVLALRAAEIAVHINGSMMPMLVATPTHTNGSINPAVLLERLTRAEAEGWQPWQFDLEQALLRLPRTGVPAGIPVAAGQLTSPAGRQFAQWLDSGGLPDPVSEPFEQLGEKNESGAFTWDAPVPRRMGARLTPARDGGLRLERQLLTHQPKRHPEWSPDDFMGVHSVLTMVLPHHREVAAAWALGDLGSLADQGRKEHGALLPLLAECTGPVGPALAYGLAYGLGAKHEQDRVAAVDAFLTLAATPEPFAAAVGAALADLCADSTVKLSRVTPALADAHRAGASTAVWELLTTVLPPLLATRLRAVPDLLELATQVAVALGPHARSTEIPGLAEVAALPGTSRLVQESKRLHTTLAGPA